MKLNDLIEALAAEVEAAQPQLAQSLAELAQLDEAEDAFLDALEQYNGQAQRMGEAAEMVGFPGLQAVCNHVLENALALPTMRVEERGALVTFLRGWPPLIVYYLRHIGCELSPPGRLTCSGIAPSMCITFSACSSSSGCGACTM